ncbi:hypothetical protein F503_02930 [Ophiostoma piceae UAMH 11346]|uniref:Aminoglycoside phosphotransferase domain-containing protein n=1 Tax=Ophiostoma piceae (strain UAMH 11346) TaxID=1262450 RepID=S3C2V3_OPHP1|nr:hypothetical protein F503_02930 [Ophiostoma piceae UAMH 11346]
MPLLPSYVDGVQICGAAGCHRLAAMDVGDCDRCLTMFCAGHKTCSTHACSLAPLDDDEWLAAQTAELESLDRKTNWPALLAHASRLAGGQACQVADHESDPLGRGMMGGMHVHRRIRFDDGTAWLARIVRETHKDPSDDVVDTILKSECATLHWLATSGCGLPTPRVHGYGLRSDPKNAVGVAYMLMDEMPGRPFDMASASEDERAHVLDQWAQMLRRLGDFPFNAIGSLVFDTDSIKDGRIDKHVSVSVGPVASDRTGTLPLTINGPCSFPSASAFYQAWAKSYVRLVESGQLFSDYADDALCMFRHIAQRLADTADDDGWLCRWTALDAGPFFLKHMDDKGDHLLVDESGTIVGVIDWTYARVVPAYEAFGPSLFSADNDKLFRGCAGLSVADKTLGRALARLDAPHNHFLSEGTDHLRQLMFGLGTGMGFTRDEARAAFAGLCSAFDKVTCTRTCSQTSLDRFTDCAWPGCTRPSVRGRGCASCRKHACAVHQQERFHAACVSSSTVDDEAWQQALDDEVAALLQKINVAALVARGSALRHGMACEFVPGEHSGPDATMGCANYHATLVFDDGVRWIVRIPRLETANRLLWGNVPSHVIEYLVASEYATLVFLERVCVGGVCLTPKAHGYGLESDVSNHVGVSYILQDALPGRPFYASLATAEQQRHVYTQYAAFLAALAAEPRAQACSLLPALHPTQGPLASDRFLRLGAATGPFSSALAYFTAIANTYMDLVADGQLYAGYPREAFLFYRLLSDQAAPVLADLDLAHLFYLKHVDDKGDHILVDDDYNITGIIDWQYARFVPAAEAFGPSLVTADLGKLYGDAPGLSTDDIFVGNALAAQLAAHPLPDSRVGPASVSVHKFNATELARRFHFGLASGLPRCDAVGLIQAVRRLLHQHQPGKVDDNGVDDVNNVEEWLSAEWDNVQVHPRDPLDEARRTKIERLLQDMQG